MAGFKRQRLNETDVARFDQAYRSQVGALVQQLQYYRDRQLTMVMLNPGITPVSTQTYLDLWNWMVLTKGISASGNIYLSFTDGDKVWLNHK